jgi:mercuric ion transport protein
MERTRLLTGGALGAAVAASICCIGPLLLAITGLGGGALLLRFTPLRPFFLIATALLLAGAFVLSYRRKEKCEPGDPCADPRAQRIQRFLLWIATILIVLLAAFPYYATYLFK